MRTAPWTRRRLRWPLVSACALAMALVASACGSTGPGTSDSTMRIWALQDDSFNKPLKQRIQSFNKNSDVNAKLSTWVNDPYKQKLQVSMGSPNAPDIFFNWGGGNLAQYVNEGQVVDLTGWLNNNPEFKNSFMPSVLDLAKINGRYYGLPMLGVQPVVMFYNKAVFEKAGVQPPKTYADLLKLVDTFKSQNITPIVLPGSQGWTELMWLEYLTTRIGGPKVFDAIQAGKEGAWTDPAIIEALKKCQQLVDKGAFGQDYASLGYDDGSASTLLAQGEAAMFVMGSWEIATQNDNNPEFLKSGNLGFTSFPKIKGGANNQEAIVGNPSNYFSITSSSKTPDAAKELLGKTLTSDQYINGLVEAGQVPAVKGVKSKLKGQDHAEFNTFVYDLVKNAPTFTQSWDQALSPDVSSKMLTNLKKVFLKEMSPKQFAQSMESLQ